jgi:hypothetical protein
VKRCSGEDTLGVTPWENSSVPGHHLTKNPYLLEEIRVFC